nr:hypothetical protein [Tanacetum cinerariifolium]
MIVRAYPAISTGHSTRVAEAMTLSDSAFRKRYRSFYETPSPSLTLPAVPAADTAVGEPLGLDYGALRCRDLAVGEDKVPCTFEVDILIYVSPVAPVQNPPSPEWSSGSLPVSPSSLVVSSPVASPVTTPTTTISVEEDQFLVRYRLRSLEWEQERDTMTFTAIWRPVLALEAWAGQIDAQREALWHDIYDIQREKHDLRMQITKERRERLELEDHVTRMERRQESREE